MGTNFNDLWSDPDFISEPEKDKINLHIASLGKSIEEADRICSGEVSAVAYDSFDDLLADIDAEIAKEDSRG